MKKHPIVRLVLIYAVMVMLFCVAKIAFMLIHWNIYSVYDFASWMEVCLHGLPIDASVAGYLTILPGLLLCAEAWIPKRTGKISVERLFCDNRSVARADIHRRCRPVRILGIQTRLHAAYLPQKSVARPRKRRSMADWQSGRLPLQS